MKKVLVGVTGSIAAYKAPELLRGLINAGFEVKSVLSKGAESFVTPITLQAASGSSVHTLLPNYEAEAGMSHIELARWADIILIAPASANFIARLACGLCDDLLNTLCLATQAHIIIAPAMNKHMWTHPATQDNIIKLKERGITFIGPDSGIQACGNVGLGRMLEPNIIVQNILESTTNTHSLKGLDILITAGGTREPIDPVRFITNKSSGKMGYALTQEAIKMGANVTLITAPTSLFLPTLCKKVIQVTTAKEMLDAVEAEFMYNNIFISSAAVSDYKIVNPSKNKIKRSNNKNLTLKLEPNVDILAKVAKGNSGIVTVGFASETENLIENAKKKLITKGIDLIIVNDVSNSNIGFNSEYNEGFIVSQSEIVKIDHSLKEQVARKILQYIRKSYFV